MNCRYPRKRPAQWTAEQDARLAKLWALGLPVNEIAEAMGKTRNAICGRRFRLALPERRTPIPQTGREMAEKLSVRRLRKLQVQAALDAARAEIDRLFPEQMDRAA